MNKLLLILTFFLLFIFSSHSCNCFISDFNFYESFQETKHSCVGKVIKKIDEVHYEFEVLRTFKGSLSKKIIIQSHGVTSCGLGVLQIGDIYLISPTLEKDKKTYNVSRCLHNAKNTSYRFTNDTTTLAAISVKDGVIDTPYFKGQIKNGKRTDTWTEYYYKDTILSSYIKGQYIKDKRNGIWVDENGGELEFKNGKLVKRKELKK